MPNQHNLKYSDADIIAALYEAYGNASKAAGLVGCTRKTIYNRIATSSDVAAAYKASKDYLVDLAEKALVEQISKGNIAAIIFTLKTQGRERGWDENKRQPTTSNRITINLVEGGGGAAAQVIDMPQPKRLDAGKGDNG